MSNELEFMQKTLNDTISMYMINLNGFAPLYKRPFVERFDQFMDTIAEDNVTIVNLLEATTGGSDAPCLEHIRQKAESMRYRVILPPFLTPSNHPKSIYNVVLIKEDEIEELETIKTRTELDNRYIEVKIKIKNLSEPLWLILVHLPQQCYYPGHAMDDGYVRMRRFQHTKFRGEIKAEVKKLISEDKHVILSGDMNSTIEGLSDFTELSLVDLVGNDKPTYFGVGNFGTRIDHVLGTKGIVSSNIVVDERFVNEHRVTDHAGIRLDIAV